MEVLAAHHFFPGRYHQRLLAHRHPRPLRRWFRDARMEEGWAVVAEELGAETGFYSEVREEGIRGPGAVGPLVS